MRTLLPLLAPALLWSQPAATLNLTLKQAIEMALAPDGNARVQLAREAVEQARSRSGQARSALLPNLEASLSEQNQTRNLAAFGIQIDVPIPGFRFPELAGPFSVFDARASVSQTVFDFGAFRRYQASRAGMNAAGEEIEAVRDLVARQVAVLYLAALRAEARVASSQADVDLAGSLTELAASQKSAGTGTGIEVTRARVQAAQARQQLLIAQSDLRQARLELLRAIGLRLDTPLRLADKLEFSPVEPVAAEKAVEIALASRADWKAQQKREEAARISYSGVKLERLPTLVGFADYGSIGTSINNAIPTRTIGLSLRVPVYNGGRYGARRAESRSQYEQERIRTADLRKQVELEIQLALDDLQSAREQVTVSAEGLAQAEAELEQAQRRYKAGVTSSLEVTDAQTRLARARDNRTATLFLYNRARLDLWQAMGKIREMAD